MVSCENRKASNTIYQIDEQKLGNLIVII